MPATGSQFPWGRHLLAPVYCRGLFTYATCPSGPRAPTRAWSSRSAPYPVSCLSFRRRRPCLDRPGPRWRSWTTHLTQAVQSATGHAALA